MHRTDAMKQVLLLVTAALALSACEDWDDYGHGPPGYYQSPYYGGPYYERPYHHRYRDSYYDHPYGDYYGPYR